MTFQRITRVAQRGGARRGSRATQGVTFVTLRRITIVLLLVVAHTSCNSETSHSNKTASPAPPPDSLIFRLPLLEEEGAGVQAFWIRNMAKVDNEIPGRLGVSCAWLLQEVSRDLEQVGLTNVDVEECITFVRPHWGDRQGSSCVRIREGAIERIRSSPVKNDARELPPLGKTVTLEGRLWRREGNLLLIAYNDSELSALLHAASADQRRSNAQIRRAIDTLELFPDCPLISIGRGIERFPLESELRQVLSGGASPLTFGCINTQKPGWELFQNFADAESAKRAIERSEQAIDNRWKLIRIDEYTVRIVER